MKMQAGTEEAPTAFVLEIDVNRFWRSGPRRLARLESSLRKTAAGRSQANDHRAQAALDGKAPVGGAPRPADRGSVVKRHPELPPHIASDTNVTEADPSVFLNQVLRVGASRSRSAPSIAL